MLRRTVRHVRSVPTPPRELLRGERKLVYMQPSGTRNAKSRSALLVLASLLTQGTRATNANHNSQDWFWGLTLWRG